MSDSIASKRSASGTPSLLLLVPLAIALVLVFVAILFPWQAVARRLAFEIGAASGARVTLEDLAPAWTARGPVLRARNVVIEHPSVRLLRVADLEVAPRFGTSWLGGKPRLRIFADSDLGVVDGVLVLGAAPAFDGRVERVTIERLPLRLSAAGVRVAGELSAEADVALDPAGTLHGKVAFESPRLAIEAMLLPKPLAFTSATGSLAILETGATRIENVKLEGEQVRGTLSGEIGLVHRSQPPPLDLRADVEVVDPELRALAQAARLPIPPDGRASLEIRGTAAAPMLLPAGGPRPAAGPAAGAPGRRAGNGGRPGPRPGDRLALPPGPPQPGFPSPPGSGAPGAPGAP
ncbi:MAG: type II secretion system protein GspN [Myxococcota bacterium]